MNYLILGGVAIVNGMAIMFLVKYGSIEPSMLRTIVTSIAVTDIVIAIGTLVLHAKEQIREETTN